jgi:hypothetical protein
VQPRAARPASRSPLTLDHLTPAVVSTAEHGGGWVQVVLQRVCASGDPEVAGCVSGESAIDESTFNAFLNWLQRSAPAGTSVQTVRQVMGATP